MKFLCVPCDQPMRLMAVKPPDRGSLSVVYSCAACGYEMAMLTNPYETQVVASLGVKIGPQEVASGTGGGTGAAAAAADDAATADGTEGGGKCPFAGMIPGLTGGDAEAASGGDDRAAPTPLWTDAASARLEVIPAFVRPMARTGIERFAREHGYSTIDEKVLDEARAFFGM